LNRTILLVDDDPGVPAVLGRSPLMRDIARQVELLATTDATVLLTGEAGTGKGCVARLLHSMSSRNARPFVEIDCAARSANFVDSEIFGHGKSARSDAREQKPGLFEVAHTGTCFLNEIGDLAPELQPRLLELLESRTLERPGGTRETGVDVRLIAATSHDLHRMVRDGRFREGLFNRLNVLPLRLPPLRERGREEIADLAVRILLDLRRRSGRGPTSISPEALSIFTHYAWPGNIRELRNVIERLLILSADAQEVQPAHLPPDILGCTSDLSSGHEVELPLEEVERRHIARVLAHHAGNRSRAARTLGISRATLYEKLARYSLDQVGRVRPTGRRRV
jgi:DNA-binding NtrC family response regulator